MYIEGKIKAQAMVRGKCKMHLQCNKHRLHLSAHASYSCVVHKISLMNYFNILLC